MSKINIKGRCKIELTDVNTGKVEAIEHDNMITKALEYFYKNGGATNPSPFTASALRTDALNYMLGGLLCLDTALEEDDEIVRVPAGVNMTANGARGILNSGNPTELGSYNDAESGWQQDGSLKMVWDWTTSQGNGTIACVGLTSLYGGMKGIGNKSGANKANSYNINSYNALVADLNGISGVAQGYKDNVIYSIQAVAGATKWTVKKYDAQYSAIDMRDTMTAREIEEIEVNIPAAIQNLPVKDGSAEMRAYYLVGRTYQTGNHLYILITAEENSYIASYSKMYFSDSAPWYAVDYDISTGTVTAVTLSPTTTGITALPVSQGANYVYGITDKWAVIGSTAVQITNLANSIDITGANASSGNRALATYDTDILEGDSRYYDIVEEHAYLVNGGHVGGMQNMPNNPLMRRSGGNFYRDMNYLATIFNLESPVQKTADKTMKVTYVLRFS